MSDTTAVLRAASFAAAKHRQQRRKDPDASPYINHPLAVAELLATVGSVTDVALLQAALLHDTIEDTLTTAEELEQEFGRDVRILVEEVTDDKNLPRSERKRLQIVHAPKISLRAQQLKIADHTCNIRDVGGAAPVSWSMERRQGYLDWSLRVIDGCRGANEALERFYDETMIAARRRLSRSEDR
jgi:guanosine-3',5'-bis(diphosphate) 3'-pyrophosphohydrolase